MDEQREPTAEEVRERIRRKLDRMEREYYKNRDSVPPDPIDMANLTRKERKQLKKKHKKR